MERSNLHVQYSGRNRGRDSGAMDCSRGKKLAEAVYATPARRFTSRINFVDLSNKFTKHMRFIALLLPVILLLAACSTEKKATKAFQLGKYQTAIELYSKLLKDN